MGCLKQLNSIYVQSACLLYLWFLAELFSFTFHFQIIYRQLITCDKICHVLRMLSASYMVYGVKWKRKKRFRCYFFAVRLRTPWATIKSTLNADVLFIEMLDFIISNQTFRKDTNRANEKERTKNKIIKFRNLIQIFSLYRKKMKIGIARDVLGALELRWSKEERTLNISVALFNHCSVAASNWITFPFLLQLKKNIFFTEYITLIWA